MEHIDETIVAIRRQQNRKKELERINLLEGVSVNHKKYSFVYKSYPRGECRLMLPDEFTPMPEEMADRTYPDRSRPQFIQSSLKGREAFTINLMIEKEAEQDQLQTLMQMRQAISNVYSSSLFFDMEKVNTINGEVVWMDFKNSTMEGPLYNMMYLTRKKRGLLLGTFYCAFEEYDDWKPIVLEVIKTIQDTEERENEGLSN